jgi:hypothetical protein
VDLFIVYNIMHTDSNSNYNALEALVLVDELDLTNSRYYCRTNTSFLPPYPS